MQLPGEAYATKPVYTQDQVVQALTTMGGRMGSVGWNGDVISYSVGTGRLAPGHAEYGSEHNGYAAMSAAMARAAADAFELWDDVVAISLVERTNDPYADITFNYSSATGNATYAIYWYQYSGGRAEHTLVDADIWLATGASTHNEDRDLYKGGYATLTYIHEIGHALGLSHPGYYNGTASFGTNATHFQDTRAYTVMSYFNAHENGSGTDHIGTAGRSYAATPLLNDILVAQLIYGADMTTRTGPTTYGFGSNAGREAFDFVKNPNPVVAIWDAGGIDTINVSGWSTNQLVDLAEGAFSSIGHLTHNLAIAWGAVVENAVGGGGNDVLLGNAAANVLRGGAGDDRLSGHSGNDVLLGGPGADRLDGGAGTDRAQYHQATSGLRADLQAPGANTGEAAGDIYVSIENLHGTSHNDLLLGDAGANTIYGHLGNDRLYGRAGHDVLLGGPGADRLDGGAETDRAQYHQATSGLRADLQAPGTNTGEAAGDVYVSIENLLGTGHNDLLLGDAGANTIYGHLGNDRLYGRAGHDVLLGGPGADRLDGGAGADLFVFARFNGSDRIDGFEPAHDTISIIGALAGFDQLAITASSSGASINYGGADAILLAGIGASEITDDLFLFS